VIAGLTRFAPLLHQRLSPPACESLVMELETPAFDDLEVR
jgi:hypothetical protein